MASAHIVVHYHELWLKKGNRDFFLHKLREALRRSLEGIAIARISVTAAQTGLETLFTLIALLSVNLAVLNLLPIPILDGGQVLITIAEGLKGKPFTNRTRENMMKVGLALIAALFMLVMFNDIKALVLSIFG